MKQLLLVVGLVACRGGREVTVDQYEEAALPGVDGARVYLDDVSLGKHAPITVRTASGDIAKGTLYRGDQLPFVLDGKTYVVTVDTYHDHLITDQAKLRVAQNKPSGPIYRIAERSTVDAAGIQVTLGPIAPGVRTAVTVVAQPSHAEALLTVGERVRFEHAGKNYEAMLLAYDGAAAYVRVTLDRR